jgi:hypothetical protein
VFPAVAFSTQVSGDVWGVWDSTMNPIEVVGELRVPPDSSLIIGPGCYIEFQDYYALTLDTSAAFIRAIGTEEDSIVFTPAPGRVWNGIDIYYAESTCEFSYCILEKATALEGNSGGAIYCEVSEIDISHCRITENSATDGRGGGIFINCGKISLSNSVISNNTSAFGGSGLYSGTCVNNGDAEIINNVFENDTTYYELGGEMSGSVECRNCPQITFEGNIIKNNLSYGVGAVRLGSSTAVINNNILSGNLGWTGRSGFWITIEDSATIAYNEIKNNGNINSGGFLGSGISLYGANITVNNNILAFNETGSSAGGFYIVGTNIVLINNVIAYNRAYNGGGIYCDNTSSQIPNILANNIIWGNISNNQIYNVDNRPLEISYCDIQGGWQGVGNIDIDPLFRDTANGDFHLMSTFCGDPLDSPCIDVGDPTIQDYLLSCNWGLGLQLSDMGAYGGGDSTLQTIEDYQPPLPEEPILLQNYPNPFNAGTTLEFYLSGDTEIKLSVFNLLGQEIVVLIDGMMSSGEHRISWDATAYPSGMYFARLLIGNDIQSRKMLLLK